MEITVYAWFFSPMRPLATVGREVQVGIARTEAAFVGKGITRTTWRVFTGWVAIILAVLIGLLHVCILVMEMLLLETPRERHVFGASADFAASTKVMAKNQGLYTGFLAAGLFFGLWQGQGGRDVVAFF